MLAWQRQSSRIMPPSAVDESLFVFAAYPHASFFESVTRSVTCGSDGISMASNSSSPIGGDTAISEFRSPNFICCRVRKKLSCTSPAKVAKRLNRKQRRALRTNLVSAMAATTLTPPHMLHTAPAAVATRTLATSSTSTRTTSFGRIKLSPQHFRGHVSLARRWASTNSDNVRDLASEKAVESGQEISSDSSKLSSGQSAGVLDAEAEDASDAASYSSNVREKVVDVASDMAVDSTEDVERLARNDAGDLAKEDGRSVEDEAERLEGKAEEVSEREARKEA